MRVRQEEVDGRRLKFVVEANDGADVIGRGTHGRFVIDRERFGGRTKRKKREGTTETAGD